MTLTTRDLQRADGPLRDWVEEFISYLRVERRLSTYTEKSYRWHLMVLVVELEKLGITSWSSVRSETLSKLAVQSKMSGLSHASIALRFSALRSLFGFFSSRERLPSNPAKGFKTPRAQKSLPKNLNVDQIDQLLRITETGSLAIRDSAMMELIYSCGLRLSEAVGLNVNMLDLQAGEVRVVGKGGKMRQLPVGRLALSALQRWSAIRHMISAPQEESLFVSVRGRRLTPRSVQKRLALWGVRQGLQPRVHPHRLRHAFATHMLESSQDLRAVQELLGHATLSSTQIYTHLNFQHLATIYDAAHPRAKRQGR